MEAAQAGLSEPRIGDRAKAGQSWVACDPDKQSGPRCIEVLFLCRPRGRGARVTLLHGYANPLKRLNISESVNLYKCLILLDSCRIHATRRPAGARSSRSRAFLAAPALD